MIATPPITSVSKTSHHIAVREKNDKMGDLTLMPTVALATAVKWPRTGSYGRYGPDPSRRPVLLGLRCMSGSNAPDNR